jgi:CheY-like chemotaxis protein
MALAKLGMMSPRTAAVAPAASSQPLTFFRDTRPQARWDSIQTRIIMRGGMQILVVEDHQDTREVLTGLLKRWGHDVSPADCLKSGMDRLEDEPPVDVILSDIALPDGTGYALVSEARRRGKRVLAIALSGYAYPSDVHIAKLTGFDHHLTKPCDSAYLRTILDDRAKWDRTPPGED